MTAPNQSEGTDWQDRIVCDPAVLSGAPTIRDTGIAVALVNQLLGRGNTVDAIIGNYLQITEEDVEACRRYGEILQKQQREELSRTIEQRTPEKVADWRERIECVPGRLGGKPVIVNTRISVELITNFLEGGSTVDFLLCNYPHIRAEDIDACVKYKATGAKLSNFTWADLNALMDADELRKS